MGDPFAPRVGGVVSADIAVPDHDREVAFYRQVLCTGENPLWREDLTNREGRPVIGLGVQSPEYAHLPVQWMPHIQVADVGESVQRTLASGGSALMHQKDDNGVSQWAVLSDPNGAAFGIIPFQGQGQEAAEGAPGAGPSSVGCVAWLDLTVPDAQTIRDFYSKAVGWSVQEVAMKDGEEEYADYNMCGGDGNPAAGICHARGVNHDLPPVWMLYLPVGDVEESLKAVVDCGGEVLKTIKKVDGDYVYAVIQDPVGVCFAIAPG